MTVPPFVDACVADLDVVVEIDADTGIDSISHGDIVVDVARVLLVVIPSKADTAYVSLLPVSSLNLVPIGHRRRTSGP